ncbi:MAG: DUF1963 domain-containing protein, partial [Novosphingobium sp.]
MKRVIAMFAAFGPGALIAAYVASSPHAAPDATANSWTMLDAAAAQLIAIRGRSVAVIGLLVLGVILSLLAAVILRGGTRAETTRSGKPARRTKGKPGPVWTPGPISSEDRIASLRRRTAGETGWVPPAPGKDPEEEERALPPRPVILIRKPRERGRDWFNDASWLGGLPRLGEVEWPRDARGTPLPFAAQIDLAELAAACPESPLPRTGALAFFLGTGAVLYLPSAALDFSPVPHDLPPAFDEGGYPFPARLNRLSRDFFPFWPVEPAVLDLPPGLRDHCDPARDQAIESAMSGLLPGLAST